MQNSNNTNESTNVYTLNKQIKKNGSFIYTVTDQTGKIISSRSSKRDYVAATITGTFYFGRVDLIGKGDHGRHGCTTPIAYLRTDISIAPSSTPEPTPEIAPLYVGQFVKYTNGSPSEYIGEIVKIDGRNVVVIDDAAGMSLWNAGHAVGSCIVAEQIKQTYDTDPRIQQPIELIPEFKSKIEQTKIDHSPIKLDRKYYHIRITNPLREWDFYMENFGELTDYLKNEFAWKMFPYAKTYVGYKIESHEISRAGYIAATN